MPARRSWLHRNMMEFPMMSEPGLAAVAPTEIRLRKDKAALAVAFDNGEAYEFPAEFLRVLSPSAEVQGHSPSERRTVGGKEAVQILEVHPVGNYAVRLMFDDMHSTGIFSWEYLFELGQNREKYWRDYLDELAEKGLSRASAAH
jgi:DUF971 family protein